jgi:MbtH protein
MSWTDPDTEDTTIYKVVMNHEEQYSIWPEHRENPLGWRDAGNVGTKAECLGYKKKTSVDRYETAQFEKKRWNKLRDNSKVTSEKAKEWIITPSPT